jgi:hypothetical protein
MMAILSFMEQNKQYMDFIQEDPNPFPDGDGYSALDSSR